MATPSARIAPAVAATSAPGPSPVTRLLPSAIDPSINARCDSDLSPGTATVAAIGPGG